MKKLLLFMTLAIFILPVLMGLSSRMREEDLKAANPLDAKNCKITYLECESNNIKECELEEYLVGVLAAEMPAEYEMEALKAQAVAARSYIVSRLGEENPQHPGAVVCDNANHCKAHFDEDEAKSHWKKEKAKGYWEKIKNAVDETKGEYMVCEEQVVEAFFFARSSGRTENSEDVWGEKRPYLKSVESAEDKTHPEFESSAQFSHRNARRILSALNPKIKTGDKPLEIGNITRTTGGSVATVEIDGEVFRGTDMRRVFGLKSANFLINTNSKTLAFTVFGYGHGVGMSQFGANCMAGNGEKYTEILSHYYTNIQIIRL
ncbi:MAG: stage II sporulation protein D [Clostridia bacterium]|nr:stage II sporulation protein D [Clostridia bacterium]